MNVVKGVGRTEANGPPNWGDARHEEMALFASIAELRRMQRFRTQLPPNFKLSRVRGSQLSPGPRDLEWYKYEHNPPLSSIDKTAL